MSRIVRNPLCWALLTLGVIALSLSGCAGSLKVPSPTIAPPAILTSVDCLAPNLSVWDQATAPPTTQVAAPPTDDAAAEHPDAPDAGSVPDGFVPVEAVRCTLSLSDGQTGTSNVVMDTFEGDFGPLLAALAEPNDVPPKDQACMAKFEFVPELFLVTATDEAIRVAWPRDVCNFTKPDTAAALEKLTPTDTVTLPPRP